MAELSYWLSLAIALDQLLNALAGGWPDETLSSRAYRRGRNHAGWRIVRRVIDALFICAPGHSRRAYQRERRRRHLPETMRDLCEEA